MLLAGRLRRRTRQQRKASAVVELAICLPLIMTLVLASIETCNMVFVQHSMQVAAYEGVRVAVQPLGETATALQTTNSLLDSQGVAGATVTCSHDDFSAVPEGEQIWINIRATCNSNRNCPSFFFGSRTLNVRCVMVKE